MRQFFCRRIFVISSRHHSFRRSIPNALRIYFSYIGSEVPFFILRRKYFSKPIFATCTHFPFLNQLTLRGGICGSATKAAPVSPKSARQIAFHVPTFSGSAPSSSASPGLPLLAGSQYRHPQHRYCCISDYADIHQQ